MLGRFVHFMQQPVFRLVYAVMWTTLAMVLLLQSSEEPVVGPPAPAGDPNLGRELFLHIGHAVVFVGMMILWWWVFRVVSPHKRALIIALTAVLVIGGITEGFQWLVPSREPSLDDLAMNWLLTVATALVIQSRCKKLTTPQV